MDDCWSSGKTGCQIGMFFKTHVQWVELFSNSYFLEKYILNKVQEIFLDGKTYLGVNQNGQLNVFDEFCPHQKASLKNAIIEDDAVVCPWHKYAFCLKSGRDLSTSGNALTTYKTKLENGVWFIGLEIKLPFWMDPA